MEWAKQARFLPFLLRPKRAEEALAAVLARMGKMR